MDRKNSPEILTNVFLFLCKNKVVSSRHSGLPETQSILFDISDILSTLDYRIPEPFKDQVVVVIGSSSSAVDISRDIAGFAKEVHVASWSDSADTCTKQTWKVLPFHMFELQSKWIAGVLSGRIKLPSKEDMLMEIKTIYATFEDQIQILGIPKRYREEWEDHHLVSQAYQDFSMNIPNKR